MTAEADSRQETYQERPASIGKRLKRFVSNMTQHYALNSFNADTAASALLV